MTSPTIAVLATTGDFLFRHRLAPLSGDEVEPAGVPLLATLAVLSGAAILAWCLLAWRRSDAAHHGLAVRLLSRGLGLAADERRLACRLAQMGALTTAGSLLISEGCFDHAAACYRRRFGQHARVARLRRRLFTA